MRRVRLLGSLIGSSIAVLLARPASAQLPTPQALSLGEAAVAAAELWGAAANPAAAIGAAWTTTGEGQPTRGLRAQAYGLSLASPAPLTRVGLDVGWVGEARATAFEVGIQHFTPPGFAVSTLRIGAARRLGEALFVGIRAGVLYGDFDEYGRETLALAEGGLQYGITNTLTLGAHYGFVQRELLPLAQQRLHVGVAYASSRKVQLLASASQAVAEPLDGQFGVRYAPAPRLRLSAGYQTLGQRLSFGTSYALRGGLRVELAAVVYSSLPTGVGYGVGY